MFFVVFFYLPLEIVCFCSLDLFLLPRLLTKSVEIRLTAFHIFKNISLDKM